MKSNTVAAIQLLSIFGISTFATPLDMRTAAIAVSQRAPITWTGEVVPGGANHTFHGDARSIYHQIRAVNPNYSPSTERREVSNPLVARNKDSGDCGTFASADGQDAVSMMNYLAELGGTCSVGAGPGLCTRLACMNTSGIYLCNDGGSDIGPSCNYLATYARNIVNQCGSSGGMSGQEFDTDAYNVVISYANCNDPTNVLPSGYAHPGPNGEGYFCKGCVEEWCTYNKDGQFCT